MGSNGMGNGDASDFKTKFYNLSGDSLKDRKRNFYKLLHDTPKSIPDKELEIQPRNFLEGLFKVEALIYFHKTPQLLKILNEGNVVFTSKIIKQKWFCEEAFSHINEEVFVNEVLPTYSYSLRMKILKTVSNAIDEARMDKLFDCILQRYGLHIAIHFLQYCSKEKIRSIITNNVVRLFPTQLKTIFDKDPQLVSVYLKEAKANEIEEIQNFDTIFKYIAQKDPVSFLNLKKDFDFSVKLGRRTSKGVILKSEEDIFKDPTKYENILNTSAMSRKIKTYDQVLAKKFPKKIKYLSQENQDYGIGQILKTYPVKRRWNVFAKTFEEVYGQDVNENLIHLNKVFAGLDKNRPELKQKWAKLNYEKTNDDSFLVDCNPNYAVPIFKEKINLTSNKKLRGQLLVYVTRNCVQYENFELLEQVLNMICIRHRNEDPDIRNNIITEIKASHLDHANKFNDNLWKCFFDMLTIQKVRDEYQQNWHVDLEFEYIKYLYTFKREQADDLCVQHIKNNFDRIFHNLPRGNYRSEKDSEVERIIISNFGKIMATMEVEHKLKLKNTLLGQILEFNKQSHNKNRCIVPSEYDVFKEELSLFLRDPKEYSKAELGFVILMLEFNQQCPDQKFLQPDGFNFLQFFSSLLDAIERLSMHWELFSILIDVITKPNRNDIENQPLELFLTKSLNCDDLNFTEDYQYFCTKVVEHFLANEPSGISKYIDDLLKFILRNENNTCLNFLDKYSYKIKKTSNIDLDKKIIEHLKEALSRFKSSNKEQVLKPLSKIMETDEFMKLIQSYVPKDKEIMLDLDNEDQKELYKFQCSLVKSLKNTFELYKTSDIVLQFCQGDFLQSTLPTFYKLAYRISEEDTQNLLAVLSKRAVSAKKHAIFLASELLPAKKAVENYQNSVTTEKNSSSLKNWFTSVLKYFVKNPSNTLLHMMLENLAKISENDPELWQFITAEVKIPKKYQPIYIENVWHVLEDLKGKNPSVKIDPYQAAILQKITLKITSDINKGFLESIIKKYFLISEEFKFQIKNIVTNYLRTYLTNENFCFIFSLVRNFKLQIWETNDKVKISRIFEFFDKVYTNLHIINDNIFLEFFKDHWENNFTIVESFREYISLKLMMLYKKDSNNEAFASKVSDLFKSIQTSYNLDGLGLIELIKDGFEQFLHSFKKKQFDILAFLDRLVTSDRNTANMLFVLWQLCNNKKECNSDQGQQILRKLESEKNTVIQIRLAVLKKRF